MRRPASLMAVATVLSFGLSTPSISPQAATKQTNPAAAKATPSAKVAPPPRAMPAPAPVAHLPAPVPVTPRAVQPATVAPKPANPVPAIVSIPSTHPAPNSSPSTQAGHAAAVPQPAKAPPTTSTSNATHPPAASPVAGLTPVKLGNGNTVYYNSAGHAFDSSGNPVSNATVASAKAGSLTTTASTTSPATGNQPTTQLSAQPSQAAPRPATPSPVAGLTPVALGNGQTVYYNSAGHAFDSEGNPVSNTTIAATKPVSAGGGLAPQVGAHPTTTSAVSPSSETHPTTVSPTVTETAKAEGEAPVKAISAPTKATSLPTTQVSPTTLSAQDKQWAATLPPDLKAKVDALPAQTVAQMKENGQWQTYQQSIQNAAASEQKVAVVKPTAVSASLPAKETSPEARLPQGGKSAPTTSGQEKITVTATTAVGQPSGGKAQTPVGLTADDKQWANTLPPNLKQEVYTLSPAEIDDLKQTGHWQNFQNSMTSQIQDQGSIAAAQATAKALTDPATIAEAMPKQLPTISPKQQALLVAGGAVVGGAAGGVISGGAAALPTAWVSAKATEAALGVYGDAADLYNLTSDYARNKGQVAVAHDVQNLGSDTLNSVAPGLKDAAGVPFLGEGVSLVEQKAIGSTEKSLTNVLSK